MDFAQKNPFSGLYQYDKAVGYSTTRRHFGPKAPYVRSFQLQVTNCVSKSSIGAMLGWKDISVTSYKLNAPGRGLRPRMKYAYDCCWMLYPAPSPKYTSMLPKKRKPRQKR